MIFLGYNAVINFTNLFDEKQQKFLLMNGKHDNCKVSESSVQQYNIQPDQCYVELDG
jgi:hypothetical protein